MKKKKKDVRKKPLRASHRKGHLAALSVPGVRDQLESLQRDWASLNLVQRGERLIPLRVAGCTARGLADDLGVDDGTIRRDIKIARLPVSQRQPIDAAANPKLYLQAARTQSVENAAQERFNRELTSGTSSDELCIRLAWFLMKEQPGICTSGGQIERLLGEVQTDLREMGRSGPLMHPVTVTAALHPACPFGAAIKLAKPDPEPDADLEEMEIAVRWLLNLILLLEPVKQLRDRAIEKLRPTLLHMHLSCAEIKNLAKSHTPATLAAVLREMRAEKPLYQ